MSGLRVGDVVTEEPTEVGTVVITVLMTAYVHTKNHAWCTCGRGVDCAKCTKRWDELHHPIRYAWGATPEPAPAEDWETVTAEQVKVGDVVEVTQEGRGWRAVTSGKVTYASKSAVTFGDTYTVAAVPSRTLATATIRRRVRTPMAEPDGFTLVRHAGRTLVRPSHLGGSGAVPWFIVDGPGTAGYSFRLDWPDVLALDPSTDPVPLDLGHPTGYVLTGDGHIEDAT